MGDPTFFRARLNGVSAEDASDPAPSGQKQAIVTYIQEDTDVTDTILGKARVYLPHNVKATLAQANLHFFGLVAGPVSLPLAITVQPRVTIRRDPILDDGTGAEMSVIISALYDHAHLVPGPGNSGGGVAFAAFAPSTKDEANTLGYTDLL